MIRLRDESTKRAGLLFASGKTEGVTPPPLPVPGWADEGV